jgi:hypothetical protein
VGRAAPDSVATRGRTRTGVSVTHLQGNGANEDATALVEWIEQGVVRELARAALRSA